MNEKIEIKEKKFKYDCNTNFYLLWQGNLISSLGNTIYSVAINFWVLAATGSTAIMGIIMASSIIPVVLLSPIVGVVIDRFSKKNIIVLADLLRGIFVVIIAILALKNQLEIWILLIFTILSGICLAFFRPAIVSFIPEIVRKEKYMSSNSAIELNNVAGRVAGMGIGGYLFSILGAPIMFLLNGISFLISSLFEFFMIPNKIEKVGIKEDFLKEIKEGYKYVWKFSGLRNTLFIALSLNFFAYMGLTLLVPLFYKTSNLGPTLYGIVMGIFAIGNLAGLLFTIIIKIKPAFRFRVFAFSFFGMTFTAACIPIFLWFPYMAVLAFIAGLMNMIVLIFFRTITQIVVSKDMRGRVFAVVETISNCLLPIAMIAAGFLAELLPIRQLTSSVFIFAGISSLPLLFSSECKKFINYDPEKNTN